MDYGLLYILHVCSITVKSYEIFFFFAKLGTNIEITSDNVHRVKTIIFYPFNGMIV